MRIPAVLLLSIFLSTNIVAQDKQKTKLVVGIVVDQMRYDYLKRYEHRFGEGGFRKFIKDGYNFKNAHFNYVPTYTGPGHASIFTGTSPRVHGIIANNWFDKKQGKMVYCAGDANENSLGTENGAGKMSPRRMLTTTFGDELRIFNQFRSKAFGVSMKDRGAILPAGHSANAAYWYDGETGNMISSTFYAEQLPKWVEKFNKKQLAHKYLKTPWNLAESPESYTASYDDDSPYEELFYGETSSTFPHNLPEIKEHSGLHLLKATPFGNDFLVDFAISLIQHEKLGQGDETDFLSISFSSTDYIGHQFGTQAMETEDCYIRLDRSIESLLEVLDSKIGLENITIFLTADHGGAYNAIFMQDHKMPADLFNNADLKSSLNDMLEDKFASRDLIRTISNQQIFLNHTMMDSLQIDRYEVESPILDFLLQYPGISEAYDSYILRNALSGAHTAQLITNGYHPARSGDIAYALEPGWMSYGTKGTTHGSSYNYDTHVPLLWLGSDIPHGESSNKVSITDIVPTLSDMFRMSPPNGATGKVLSFE
jgi:predicted AlkP superfamily pyrophosphatase or phosphodiesterase